MNTIPQDAPQKQCKDCEQFFPATKDYFTPDKAIRNGLRNVCKSCRQKKRRKTEILPERHKRCAKCEHLLPATEQFFYRDSSAKSGLRSQCRVCEHPQEHRQPVPNGFRRCTQCEKVFPATTEFFSRHRQGKNGLRAACKPCSNDKGKIYEKEHAEKINIRRKRRRETDQAKARRKAWTKEYCQRRAKEFREYRAKNADSIREYQKEYRKTHRAEHAAHNHNREAKKRQAKGKLTLQQIQFKLKAQRYRCYYAACGHAKFKKIKGRYQYHIEHTIPLSRVEETPRHDINYVVLACPTCNLSKHNKLPHEWPEGGRLC